MLDSNVLSREEILEGSGKIDPDSLLSVIPVKNAHPPLLKSLMASISLSLAALHFGYYLAIFNPMGEPLFTHVYGFDKDEKVEVLGNVNMIYGFGALLGASITGKISESIGRRRLVIIYDILSVLTGMAYYVKSIPVLYVIRFISGYLGIGGYMLSTITQAELLSKKLGPLCNGLAQFMFSLSVFFAYISQNIFSSEYLQVHWREILCWPAIVAALKLFLLLLSVRTEPAKYYITRHSDSPSRDKELGRILSQFNDPRMVDFEIQQCVHAFEKERAVRTGPVWNILTTHIIRKRLLAGILIGVSQQFAGVPFFSLYSTDIFNKINGKGKQATLFVAIAKVTGAFITLAAVKFIGRKVSFYVGISGQILGLFAIIVSIDDNIEVLAYIGICSFMSCFSIGIGGSSFIFLNEILPPIGVSVSTGLSWLVNSVVAKLLPILTEEFGAEPILIVLLIFNVILLILVDILVLETRGKPESQIIREYSTRKYRPFDFN